MPADDRKYFVHESSYVDEGAEIGAGTRIWHFCHVMAGARVGADCNIGQNVVIGPDEKTMWPDLNEAYFEANFPLIYNESGYQIFSISTPGVD